MPNMDLIHARQKMEGFEPCFGRAENTCHRTGCRWHGDCAALAAFEPLRGLGAERVMRSRSMPSFHATPGSFRDGNAVAKRSENAVPGISDLTTSRQA